ncbi:CRISPR-associated helicase Cas3' [Bacillus sp. 2205SS5-2]|uniref:CRISPR-associated helicase Cas3' n=1 Tax=Bacillus sp. 2205SS5-2 TaxID=3109031 RepID=UPI003006CEA6
MNYIAHIRNSDGEEQSLEKHLEGVSSLAASYGEKIGLKHLAELAGILHDAGKISDEFQQYLKLAVYDPEHAPRKGSVDHSTAGGKWIYEKLHQTSSAPSQKLLAEIVSNLIISHHMGLQNFLSPELTSDVLYRVIEKDLPGYEQVKKNLPNILQNHDVDTLIHTSLGELIHVLKLPLLTADRLPFTLALLSKYLFSCLIDADRTETRVFEEKEDTPLPKNHQELFLGYYHRLISHVQLLKEKSDPSNPIHRLRAEMSVQCDQAATKPPGIYTLSIPTGGGKTLASLRYALRHATHHKKERIIYIVPYTTIIEQNAADVRKILMDDANILEHHSNVIQEDWLVDKEDDPDYVKNKKLKLAKDNWDSPIIFTTMVQYLNTFYSRGTRNVRRLHNLANAILIFDEVQSVPVNCISLFNESINFLRDVCRSTILLCTATQPALDEVKKKMSKPDGELIQQLEQVTKAFKRVNLMDSISVDGWDTDDVAEFIKEKVEEEQSVLCILNTKTVVRKLYEKLKEENLSASLYHLSTSMCAAHRIQILAEVRSKLSTGEKVICLSTQLIEAGVDVSFGSVIRSLAGLDSIAQAAGRCNRHGEKKTGNVYIIKHREENLQHLKSIKVGAEITAKIILDRQGGSLDDLLSQKTMKYYFQSYYHEMKGDLDYFIPKLETDMTSLLNENGVYANSFEHATGKPFPLILRSSLKTAANHFEVIDSPASSVIVPYGDGEDIIADLNENLSIEIFSEVMKKAQQYTIGVYAHELNQLSKNGDIISLRDGQFLILRENAYDLHYGLNVAGEVEMDTLFG